MLNIGQTSFDIRVPSLQRAHFESYSTNLFDVWEKDVAKTIPFEDYALSLEIEEGSITGKGKIAVTAGVLYFGIGAYGDFIGGLETIYGQLTHVSERLFQAAKSPVGGNSVQATKRISAGAVSSMRVMFERVRSGTLTVDEAMNKFESMLGDELSENSAFVRDMRAQLEVAPSYPKQLSLEQDDWEKEAFVKPPQKTPRAPKPKPTPSPEHYRMEIWRESRNDRKQIKFIKVK